MSPLLKMVRGSWWTGSGLGVYQSKGRGLLCWARDIAPSTELRKWYGHDPRKWEEFKRRYFKELDANPKGVEELISYVRKGRVTLVYSSTEPKINNAAALKKYLEKILERPTS